MAITKATASSIAPAAKGDLVVGSATNDAAILAVGTNNHILTADSAEATGMKWAAASATSGPAFRANRTANYSISQNTHTKVNFNEEDFDTNSNYDSTTNFRFTPTTAGYYKLSFSAGIVGTAGQLMTINLYKNGTAYQNGSGFDISSQGYGTMSSSDLVYFNGSSDYAEVFAYTSSSGASILGEAGGTSSVFSGVWIRS